MLKNIDDRQRLERRDAECEGEFHVCLHLVIAHPCQPYHLTKDESHMEVSESPSTNLNPPGTRGFSLLISLSQFGLNARSKTETKNGHDMGCHLDFLPSSSSLWPLFRI